jgi:hypothetical protein
MQVILTVYDPWRSVPDGRDAHVNHFSVGWYVNLIKIYIYKC